MKSPEEMAARRYGAIEHEVELSIRAAEIARILADLSEEVGQMAKSSTTPGAFEAAVTTAREMVSATHGAAFLSQTLSYHVMKELNGQNCLATRAANLSAGSAWKAAYKATDALGDEREQDSGRRAG